MKYRAVGKGVALGQVSLRTGAMATINSAGRPRKEIS